MKVYDATNQILGRLSAVIAKDLINGERVFVVNCEKAIVTGNPRYVVSKYLQKIGRGDAIHGPFFPRTPDGIFRRAVRGMLPWHRPKGRNAFKRLRVFIGLPEEYKNRSFEKLRIKDLSGVEARHITLGELSFSIGAKKRW